MGKHTAGPWNGKRIDIAVHHFEAIGATIAFTGKSEEAMANAALIATAPELLDMLEKCYESEWGYGLGPTHDEMVALIAKAKGGKA